MTRRPPPAPEDPALLARRAARQAADAGWLWLRAVTLPALGSTEVVDAIEQRARVILRDGRTVKVWRVGDGFSLALEDRLILKAATPDEVAASLEAYAAA